MRRCAAGGNNQMANSFDDVPRFPLLNDYERAYLHAQTLQHLSVFMTTSAFAFTALSLMAFERPPAPLMIIMLYSVGIGAGALAYGLLHLVAYGGTNRVYLKQEVLDHSRHAGEMLMRQETHKIKLCALYWSPVVWPLRVCVLVVIGLCNLLWWLSTRAYFFHQRTRLRLR
jgi:hypothetical protein